ncbi:DUF2244 domain-containing protein, partial [Phenylobacterium sp.]|uniref:DUF2244 domain-containing protein n=1 Tax=Phenylobacterium sp. TaxID=1871053 RepID=UPI002F3E2535
RACSAGLSRRFAGAVLRGFGLVAGLAIAGRKMVRADPFRQGGFRAYVRRVAGQTYMDAVITPHRSLSERGFIILISAVTLANCCSAAVFVYMGAVLVPFFLGLDLLAVVVAFMVSFGAARRIERVTITARDVVVKHETPNWSRVVWESPTAFTRVAVETEDDRTVDLRLALSGKQVSVAQALSPRERGEFAQALEKAIWEARREWG